MSSAFGKGNCWKCGAPLEGAFYGRRESCPQCGRDTHVCKNCIHYDTAYNNSCKENQADRVVEKEKANFCDYFSPSPRAGEGAQSKADLRAAAEALFKKKS